MTIVLQRKGDSKYIRTRSGAWTAKPDAAFEFKDSFSALMYCLEHHLPGMQIQVRFVNSEMNFYLPVVDVPECEQA